MCHTHVSHKMALPLGCVCGKCPDATRLHHQCAEKTWQQALVSADCVVPSWTHSWNTERLAAPPKPHEGAALGVRAVLGGLKLADPGITTKLRGPTATQSRPTDLCTTAAVPGLSAALDCVWLLPMQHQHEVTQPRLRLIANYPTTRMRSQIGVTTAFTVRRMGDHSRPSLEHCSMQQTSLPAATVNKMSAKSLQRRWKREIHRAFAGEP